MFLRQSGANLPHKSGMNIKIGSHLENDTDTVDGRNPAPVDMVNIP